MTLQEALEVIRYISRDDSVLDGLEYVRDVLDGEIEDEFGLNEQEIEAFHMIVKEMRPLFL